MDVTVEPLTPAAFAPFGDVLCCADNSSESINQGFTQKFADLATLDVSQSGGRPAVHIFRSTPPELPFTIGQLERHPLGSQAFMPLGDQPYLVVVAPPGELDESAIRIFLASPNQGVHYRPGTWHHFSLALNAVSDFLVMDRLGPGANCDERALSQSLIITREDLPW